MDHTLQTIPIGAFVEAIGRTAAKHQLDICCHPNGEPKFSIADDIIRFEATDREHNNLYLSVCLNRWRNCPIDVVGRIKTSASIEGLATARLLPEAVGLHSATSGPLACDVMVQERNTPLRSHLTAQIALRRADGLRTALQSLPPLLHIIDRQNLLHGNIDASKVEFSPSNHIRLLDYPTSLPRPLHPLMDDIVALTQVAVVLFVAACNPKAYQLLHQQAHDTSSASHRLRCILSAAEHHHLPQLTSAAKHLIEKADRHTLIAAVDALSVAPFAPMPLLPSLLEHRTQSAAATANLPSSPQREFVELDKCEQVLPASNRLVRFKRFDRWGYATHQGEVIYIERPLLAAFEFCAGRAVVRTTRGYGLIDEQGRWIIEDRWDDVGWFGNEGVATACDHQGRWHILCGQTGRKLSSEAADWMGEAAEGFIVARRKGLYGYYSTRGQVVSRFMYAQAYGFFGGAARVKCRDEWYYIDTSFHRLSARQAAEADRLREQM